MSRLSHTILSNDVKGSFFSQFFNQELLQKKIKAFSTHLFFSTILIASFFLFAIFHWFPDNSIALSGITGVLLIIITADLIIGPALTFLVFNPAKKSLKFDLGAILALQLAMFTYGAFTVYQAHPVFITFAVDRFTLVTARDANPNQAKYSEYFVSKLAKPTYAYAKAPSDPDARNKLLFDSISGGIDLDAMAQYYQPYEKNIKNIISKGWPEDLIFVSDEQKQQLATFMRNKNLSNGDIVFIPAQGTAKFMTFVVDKQTGKPIGSFDIDPWASQENQASTD